MMIGLVGAMVVSVRQSSMQCLRSDGSYAPCGPGNDQCGPALTGGPKYHITDQSCGMNDPNGPFFDVVHGVYHVFYQDHLWAPMPDDVPLGREGPVWGHAVSRDMVHWAHVPVGLWNGDGWYDMHGIYTGSATIVDELGGPALVFPGVCDLYPPGSAGEAVPGCAYGYAFGMAVPADASDPLLRNWTKFEGNPIVTDTFDDPSTAWRTPHGEWRMIGHCGDGTVGDCGPGSPDVQSAPIWTSADFRSWRRVGFTNLPAGECASIYPLPPLVEGTVMPSAAANLTHVHKWGCGWTLDCYALGAWADGAGAHEPGHWTSAPTSPEDALYERGIRYAAKDFWDEAQQRRLDWGWAPLYTDSFTLPREVRYDPRLEQLVFAPVAEQAQLRNGTLAERTGSTPLGGAHPLTLNASMQAEALLVFALPDEAVTLTVTLSASAVSSATGRAQREGGSAAAGSKRQLLGFVVEYSPPRADRTASASGYHTIKVKGTSTAGPEAVRARRPRKGAVVSGRSSTVSSTVGSTVADEPAADILAKKRQADAWEFTDELRMLPSEKALRLRLFFDHTIAEAYWHDRVAMTLPLALPEAEQARAQQALELQVSASSGAASLSSAHVWSVGSMWVPAEKVESPSSET